MTINNNETRLERIEASLERSTGLLERVIQVQENQQTAIEVLLRSQTRQDTMIERLDAIIERLVYREGRDNIDGDR